MMDSHVHLDMSAFDMDRGDVLLRARASGISRFINIAQGPEPEKLQAGVSLTSPREGIFTAIGVHPHEASRMTPETLQHLRILVSQPGIVAIGEIGLDYFYNRSSKEQQLGCFGDLLDLAIEVNLPVVIHCRDAFDDAFRLVSERDLFRKVGGVLHCFTGNQAQAQRFVEAGSYLSFSGILTFKNAEPIREAAKWAPLDRILVETDAPFLAPEPYRGKRNEPAYVLQTAGALAKLKGIALEEIDSITDQNAERLFRLP